MRTIDLIILGILGTLVLIFLGATVVNYLQAKELTRLLLILNAKLEHASPQKADSPSKDKQT